MTREDEIMMCKHVILTAIEVLEHVRGSLIDIRERLSGLCKTTYETKAEIMLRQLDTMLNELQSIKNSLD